MSLLLDALKEAQKQRQVRAAGEQSELDDHDTLPLNENEEALELELELDLELAVPAEEEPTALVSEDISADSRPALTASLQSETAAGLVASDVPRDVSSSDATSNPPLPLEAQPSADSSPVLERPALGTRVNIDSAHSANAVFRNRGGLKEKRPLVIALVLLCLVSLAVMAYVFFLANEYSLAPPKAVGVQKMSSPATPVGALAVAGDVTTRNGAAGVNNASLPAEGTAKAAVITVSPSPDEVERPAAQENPAPSLAEQSQVSVKVPSNKQNEESNTAQSSAKQRPELAVASNPRALRTEPEPAQDAVTASQVGFSGIQIHKRRIPEKRNEQLRLAEEALHGGQLHRAEVGFSAVLKTSPANVTALLGMANVLVMQGQHQQAQLFYRQVLVVNPQHLRARAGLLGLASSSSLSIGSGLQQLIEENPAQAFLHASLGNYYLKRREWGAAQEAYFDAFSRDAKNADYAYNLAICLDQMLKPKLALQFYRQALELERTFNAHFERSVVLSRIAVLKATQG
ncbi:hypothetical protein A9Q89_11205 [Gammaproteobacteria bacterium 53_120_T64]|nr:hypothetical protein A9Q89_11205 [Gammaproteobacteria bacterium 53_120_T64]